MTKFIYNTTGIYTLLFKQGNLEIRPGKYISVEDDALGEGSEFLKSESSGQVKIYAREEDIPKPEVKSAPAPVKEPVIAKDPSKGLTAEELAVELALRDQNRQPPGKVTVLGQAEGPRSTPVTTSIGTKSEPEQTEPKPAEPIEPAEQEKASVQAAKPGRKKASASTPE